MTVFLQDVKNDTATEQQEQKTPVKPPEQCNDIVETNQTVNNNACTTTTPTSSTLDKALDNHNSVGAADTIIEGAQVNTIDDQNQSAAPTIHSN